MGLLFLFPFVVAVLVMTLISYGGWLSYSGVYILFFIHPLLENTVFKNSKLTIRPSAAFGKFLLAIALPFSIVLIWWGWVRFNNSEYLYEKIGVILSIGILQGAMAINIAHEMIHAKQKWMRGLGFGLLLLVNFMHWGVEHVFGHHKNVGTFEDPATARKGEALYAFWLRNYVAGFKSAWSISHQKGLLNNKILYFQILQVLLASIFFGVGGAEALAFYLGQSMVAILLLLTVDYTEHYGLRRHLNSSGRIEPVKPKHSWDSYKPLTNLMLLNLGFHSHHHFKAVKPFWELEEQPEASQLPFGYSLMLLVALVPPLYFKLVDPLLVSNTVINPTESKLT